MLSSPSELRESVGGKRVTQGNGEQKMGKEGMPGGLWQRIRCTQLPAHMCCSVCVIFTPLSIFSPPPFLTRGFVLLLLLGEGLFSHSSVFKPSTPRQQLPLPPHTSLQHDLWVASKGSRVGLLQPFVPLLGHLQSSSGLRWIFLTLGS